MGGGASGGPRCCAERGRGRRGANMSSELKTTCRCVCARGNTGSTRLRPLPRELPLIRAARPGKLLRKRSGKDGRRAGSAGATGFGLLDGRGGGGGRDGEMGRGTGAASVPAVTGCAAFVLACSMSRLSARLRHSTVSTTSRQIKATTGGIMAAASTPPDVGLLDWRTLIVWSESGG